MGTLYVQSGTALERRNEATHDPKTTEAQPCLLGGKSQEQHEGCCNGQAIMVSLTVSMQLRTYSNKGEGTLGRL